MSDIYKVMLRNFKITHNTMYYFNCKGFEKYYISSVLLFKRTRKEKMNLKPFVLWFTVHSSKNQEKTEIAEIVKIFTTTQHTSRTH